MDVHLEAPWGPGNWPGLSYLEAETLVEWPLKVTFFL